MKAIEDALAALPAEVEGGPYDGMTVSPAHFDRIRSVYTEVAATFAGVTIVANPAIPEGFAVITRSGQPVGIINFKDGTATLVKPTRDPFKQH